MIDLKELYNILINEVNSDTLQPIDKSLYLKIAEELSNIKGYGYEGLEAEIRDSLIENISRIISTLFKIRLSKYNTNKANLTYEELYVISSNDEYKSKEEFVIRSIIEGRKKVVEDIAERIKNKRIVVRILKDVDEFIGVDNLKYGKYNPEDVTVLPFEDARRLINSGYAVEVITSE